MKSYRKNNMTTKLVTPESVKSLMQLTPMRYYLGSDMVEAMPYPHNGQPGMLVLREKKEGDLTSKWMPLADFNRRFSSVQKLSFGQAMLMLEQGLKVSRKRWGSENDTRLYLILTSGDGGITLIQDPEADGPAIKTKQWVPVNNDIVSNDWYLVHYDQLETEKETAYGSSEFKVGRYSGPVG